MSLPMKELRFGAPELTHIFLEHEAHRLGLDKNELARKILNDWACRAAHAHNMVQQELESKRIKLDRAGLRSIADGADCCGGAA
jgi:hypothetical protein